MPDTSTPNQGFTLIEVGGSDNTWGDKLNDNFSAIDTLLDVSAEGSTFLPRLNADPTVTTLVNTIAAAGGGGYRIGANAGTWDAASELMYLTSFGLVRFPGVFNISSTNLANVAVTSSGQLIRSTSTTATQTFANTAAADAANTAEANANGYTDTQITSARAYTDTETDAALASANAYTDTEVAAALASARAYTDTAETDANNYTNSAISGATSIGGVAVNSIVHGTVSTGSSNVAPNSIRKSGFYAVLGTDAGNPFGTTTYLIHSQWVTSTHGMQIAAPNGASTTAPSLRVLNNGTWTSWLKLASEDMVNARVAAHDVPNQHRNITYGTAAPSGGANGDIYLRIA